MYDHLLHHLRNAGTGLIFAIRKGCHVVAVEDPAPHSCVPVALTLSERVRSA